MKTKLLILLIFLLASFAAFFRIEYKHGFAWDQERDAEIVFSRIISQKDPVLLGPRVVGPEGFFLGPLHYYLLVPFYMGTSGNPIAGPYLAASITLLTVLGGLILVAKILNLQTALVFGLITATTPFLVSWNVMYLPILTILFYFFSLKIIEGNYNLLPLAFLVIAIGLQFHFTTIFLIFNLLISLIISKPKTKNLPIIFKKTLIGLVILLVSLFPLFVFDLKHNFLNTKLFLNFFFGGPSKLRLNLFESARVFSNTFNGIMPFVNRKATLYINLISFLILITYLFKQKGGIRLLNFFWVFFPPLAFSFYGGNVSEYYFTSSATLSLIASCWLISQLISKLKFLGLPLLYCIVLLNLYLGVNYKNGESLWNKKQLVEYMVNQERDPVFNISYSTIPGHDVGFKYLFDYYGELPQDIPEGHLYTIIIPPDHEDIKLIKTYGNIGLARR